MSLTAICDGKPQYSESSKDKYRRTKDINFIVRSKKAHKYFLTVLLWEAIVLKRRYIAKKKAYYNCHGVPVLGPTGHKEGLCGKTGRELVSANWNQQRHHP